MLADLGVASPQIDDPARGFSYRRPCKTQLCQIDPTNSYNARLRLRGSLQILFDMA